MESRKVSQPTALKFLLGRKFDMDRAHLLLNNYNRMVLEHHFESVTISDVIDQLRSGLMMIPGLRDRNGAALFLIDAGRYKPGQFTLDELLRLAFFMGERVLESPRTQSTGLTLIIDMGALEWANFELGVQKRILALITENMPARVKNILLYRPPWWISTLVKMVSPFLKEKMRQRLQCVDEGAMIRYCEPGQLPKSVGGQAEVSLEDFIQTEIERQGRASFQAARHLDEEGRVITAVPVQAAALPPGSVQMVPPQIEADLQAERERMLQTIDERLRVLREETAEVKPGPQRDLKALLGRRASRLKIDLVPLLQQQQQPNNTERRESKLGAEEARFEAQYGESSVQGDAESMVESRESMKARIKAEIKASIAAKRGEALEISSPEVPALTETPSPVSVVSPEAVSKNADESPSAPVPVAVEQQEEVQDVGPTESVEAPTEESSTRESKRRRRTVTASRRPEAMVLGSGISVATVIETVHEETLPSPPSPVAAPSPNRISVTSPVGPSVSPREPSSNTPESLNGEETTEEADTFAEAITEPQGRDLLGSGRSGRRRASTASRRNRTMAWTPESAANFNLKSQN